LLLLLLAACGPLTDHYGAPADPEDHGEVVFTVPAGASARSLAPKLAEAGLVASADDYVMWLRLSEQGACIKAGRHKLRPDMSADDLTAGLCGAPLPEDIPFTVVEGWRIKEIDEALTKNGWIKAGEYAALAAQPERFKAPYPLPSGTLEGYLFPETYMVIPDKWDTAAFIQRQLDQLNQRFYTPNEAEIGASKRSFAELVIMASMLEREEPKPSQRPMVAGILWKRIDANWNLGVDATSRYTLDQWNDRKAFLKKLRDPEDPYNSRLRLGLPPTPIGNPSVPSLEAALRPTDSEYWYYLHDSSGTIHPGRDVAEHEAYRKQYNVY